MLPAARAIRTFIGAKDYQVSRSFYRDLGFEEHVITDSMSLFQAKGLSFYLQNYYVKDWVDNSMVFLEVDDAAQYWEYLQGIELDKKYGGTRLVPLQTADWGTECLLIDPSGVLWHFGQFLDR